MVSPPMACVVCLQPGRQFRHLYDVDLIEIAVSLGFQAHDNFCDGCYSIIEARRVNAPPSELSRMPTVDTIETSLPPSQSSQPRVSSPNRRTMPRLSEMPIPISPPQSTPSDNSLEDTVDRMVYKKRRISKRTIDLIASQSLSVENLSSQDLTKVPRRSEKSGRTPEELMESLHRTDDSSLEDLQVAPMPKNRRVRPTAKQFATGRLELPSFVKTKVLSDDFPRVSAG